MYHELIIVHFRNDKNQLFRLLPVILSSPPLFSVIVKQSLICNINHNYKFIDYTTDLFN